ncbi:extensin family protein [Leisingera sp. D0M16]|uniref:extensin-like domain-containing protein n=1 Tax=Leisingera coralii TaxID=3351347 RepID=UPI003B7C9EE7
MIRAGAVLAALVLAAAPALAQDPPSKALKLLDMAALSAPAAPLPPVPLPQAGAGNQATEVLFGRKKRLKGAVCGDKDIKGEPAGDVAGALPGCGAKDAVMVREIAGVRLSQTSLMTCNTARALKTWINREVETAFGRRNKVVGLRVAAHYACRTRNNRPGAKISEHGRARAIDISGFTLESGETITVLQGWQKRKTRKKLKKIWRAACGPFGTVLGPEADRYHRDHFHLDVARHRGGTYCR